MNMTGNTILITGGGSGIGRALAEEFHKSGNTVIVAGRRQQALEAVVDANPGMKWMVLDIAGATAIETFGKQICDAYPGLNVVIHNSGIMKQESFDAAPDYLATAEEIVATNLLGPIRLTAALLPHLQKQPRSAILTVSSGLAFVPMAMTPTYSATKAAIHVYSMCLRNQLKNTGTQVIEIVPPYVQTTLTGEHQSSDPNAMPLEAYIAEVMDILTHQPEAGEIVVERCKPLRHAAENGKLEALFASRNP